MPLQIGAAYFNPESHKGLSTCQVLLDSGNRNGFHDTQTLWHVSHCCVRPLQYAHHQQTWSAHSPRGYASRYTSSPTLLLPRTPPRRTGKTGSATKICDRVISGSANCHSAISHCSKSPTASASDQNLSPKKLCVPPPLRQFKPLCVCVRRHRSARNANPLPYPQQGTAP